MRNISILIVLTIVTSAWAGLGDLGKLKKLVDKKDDKAEKKDGSTQENETSNASEPADPTTPINKPEDVDKGGKEKSIWHDAKVGWMVKNKMINDMAMKMEVVEVKDRVILMKSTMYQKGKPVSKSLMYYTKFDKKAEGKPEQKTDVEITELPDETLKIGDKKVKCKVTKSVMKSNGKIITSTTWMSKDVPGEIVKSQSDGMGKMQVMTEVIEFKK
ncbi:MAG: hypothetical protein JXA11_10320 [Phycisphaerae bacterium]|nr:hypothetical protein [Phycisphaerae bacterium]